MKSIIILTFASLLSTICLSQQLIIEHNGNDPVEIKTNNDKNVSLYTTHGLPKGYLGLFSDINDMDFGTAIGNNLGKVNLTIEGMPRLTVLPEGKIDVHDNNISNVADPQFLQDAATKAYVDNLLVSFGISLGPTGIQGLLAFGYTPLELINDGANETDFIGLNYQGGIIFYIESDGTGLVAAPTDQSTGIEWGCISSDLPNVPNVPGGNPPSGLGAEIGDGTTNTTNILNDCPTAPAALACTQYAGGGYADWFLPSPGELNLMWENLADSDGDDDNTGPNDPNNIGGFAESYYWSSSEVDACGQPDCAIYAWEQFFGAGLQTFFEKSSLNRVRAIRAF